MTLKRNNKPRKQLKRNAGLKKRQLPGRAHNSTLRSGPWNRDGKISRQVKKTLSTDRIRSLWVRTINASWNFVMRSPEGSFPKGAEGLKWGVCNLEKCNRLGNRADHLKSRQGATSPSKTDVRGMGVLCEGHNDYEKGSEDWGDYRPEALKKLIYKLWALHFDEDPLRPGKFEINSRGRSWLRDMYGSL